ncbi:MAG: LexA family transcriptional regulator [Gemmiger sp.]|uniref:LexA family protein n=1 Tax=Gemmiger sp. TaxID=2049027 RepID=UPI002E779DD7|nr:LexA family transcriptional regulator [Gemmiger sp.]MEE0709939.1 LexA family transcriptional regulator [Gemmiger sp.]
MSDKVATFARRLREGLDVRGMTQAELAKRSGISKSSISRYIKGDWEGKQSAVYELAKALGVTEAWLMGYDVPMESDTAPAIPPGFEPLPKMVKRPLVGSIACGEPITAEENIEDYVDVPENVQCDFCLRCKGDSMIDAGIHDGDVVYIHITPQVENGQIAAVRIDGEATLKRVFWNEETQTLQLLAENRNFAPLVYTGPVLNTVHIEGRAVGYTHWF